MEEAHSYTSEDFKGGQASAILQNSCLCEDIYLHSRSPMVCKYHVTVIPIWIFLENLDIIDQLIYIQLIYRLRVFATPLESSFIQLLQFY